MTTQYFVLRGCKFKPKPSGKPDGMFLRPNGAWISQVKDAQLFTSEQEARDFHTNVYLPLVAATGGTNHQKGELWIIPVSVKVIANKAGKKGTLI